MSAPNLQGGTTLEVLLHLGARLDAVLEEVGQLSSDAKPHAVYSMPQLEAAYLSLADAKKGLAQSIGYAAMREQRNGMNVEKRLRRDQA